MPVIANPQMGGNAQNNIIHVASRIASVASPIATLSGVASGTFTLPASIVIPAGLITPHSEVMIEMQIKRTGATATAQIEAYIGTANTSSDSLALRVSNNATDGHHVWLFGCARFGTSTTSFLGQGVLSPQGSNAAGSSIGDKNTNINTAATMYVNFGISSANAADSFALLHYRVWVRQ